MPVNQELINAGVEWKVLLAAEREDLADKIPVWQEELAKLENAGEEGMSEEEKEEKEEYRKEIDKDSSRLAKVRRKEWVSAELLDRRLFLSRRSTNPSVVFQGSLVSICLMNHAFFLFAAARVALLIDNASLRRRF